MTTAETTYSGPQEDVAAILALVEEWDALTRAGDHAALLERVTEDCVFLAPGFPPMRGRASLSPLLAGFSLFRIEPLFEVQEVVVSGDWAFLWARDEPIQTGVTGPDPEGVTSLGSRWEPTAYSPRPTAVKVSSTSRQTSSSRPLMRLTTSLSPRKLGPSSVRRWQLCASTSNYLTRLLGFSPGPGPLRRSSRFRRDRPCPAR
jgi:ketosteroid isomerase-like protein